MDGEYTATVLVHHSVNKLGVPLLNTETYNEIKDEIWMGNKKDMSISQFDLEAIKQVCNAITATTNRWRSLSLEVIDFGLCVHKVQIIIRDNTVKILWLEKQWVQELGGS